MTRHHGFVPAPPLGEVYRARGHEPPAHGAPLMRRGEVRSAS